MPNRELITVVHCEVDPGGAPLLSSCREYRNVESREEAFEVAMRMVQARLEEEKIHTIPSAIEYVLRRYGKFSMRSEDGTGWAVIIFAPHFME